MKKITNIALVGLTTLTLVACGGNTEPKIEKKTEEVSTTVKEEVSNNSVKIGDVIKFKDVEITIKNAEWTEERNNFEKEQPKKVLLVTYDVKNASDKDYPVGGEIKLYANGKKASTYPIQVTLDSISPNRTLENATQAFGVNEDGDLELEIKPILSFDDKPVVIKLDLK